MKNFKKVLSMVIVLAMALTTLMIVPLTTSADATPVTLKGQGTAANPFLVGTADELAAVKALTVDPTDVKKEIWPYDAIYVKLIADVTVAADFQMTAAAGVYEGTSGNDDIAWKIDGNGHKIAGLTKPFFATLSTAPEAHEFRDLTLEGAVESAERYVGMLTGVSFGDVIIENVTTNGSVKNTCKKGGQVHTGGFIGYVAQEGLIIRDCVNNATVINIDDGDTLGSTEGKRTTAAGFVGILDHYTTAGDFEQIIQFCTNNGAITSVDIAGGIVGTIKMDTLVRKVDIYNNVNNGAVTGTNAKGAIYAYAYNTQSEDGSKISVLENYTTVADLAISDATAEPVSGNKVTPVIQTEQMENKVEGDAIVPYVYHTNRNYTAAEAADAANAEAIAGINARFLTVYEIDSLDDLKALKIALNEEIIEIPAPTDSDKAKTKKVLKYAGRAVKMVFVADVDYGTVESDTKFQFNNNIYGGDPTGMVRWVIDGNGYSLSNNIRPMFGGLNAAGSLTVRDLHSKGNIKSGERYIAPIAGSTYCDVLFENCTVSGSITSTTSSGACCVGAFVGYHVYNKSLTLKNCTNLATITAVSTGGNCHVGGLIGKVGHYGASNYGGDILVENCVNAGAVTGTHFTGGIIGNVNPEGANTGAYKATIKNSVNTGAVTGGTSVGAMIGGVLITSTTEGLAVTVENSYTNVAALTAIGASVTTTADGQVVTASFLDATAAADAANADAVAAIAAKAIHEHVYVADCAGDCISCDQAATRQPTGTHEYADTTCDTDCNKCGEIREVTHAYENACDAECDCGATRTPDPHQYDNDCDTTCNVCNDVRPVDPHDYDNACDAECNECGATRTPDKHVYDNDCDVDCNVCFAEREIEHTYANACDGECDVCGATRTPDQHVYDDEYDASCNVCGATRTAATKPADTTKAPETTAAEEGGCGSALNSTYAIIALVAVLGFAFVAKKREEN